MTVLRIHKKQQNFVILDKTCLNDENLSWQAKGLHSYLMSLPDEWKVRVSDLKNRARNGRDAVRALLCELELAGYIQKSTCRDDASGRFGGIEYIVLEIPETDKPFSVKIEQIKPCPENPSLVRPATVNPLPVNPTLINNNKININKPNNKTAANYQLSVEKRNDQIQCEKAAAVNISQSAKQKVELVEKAAQEHKPIHLLSQQDAIIGTQLTKAQKQKISVLAKGLNIPNKENLMEEIEFTLLNTKHFTGCGLDFIRKLNAIRTVILRGEWQTPTELVLEKQQKSTQPLDSLQRKKQAAVAEVNHFQRLLDCAKEDAKDGLRKILQDSKSKIRAIEKEIIQIQESLPNNTVIPFR